MTGYNTRQRQMIISCLKENSDRHMTADMLIKRLLQNGVSVGRATVYRTLDKLCREGAVRRYELSVENSACYQYIDGNADCGEHFHLKCECCGELIHLDCGHISKLSEHIEKEHAFKVDNAKTVLYGLCENCAAASMKNRG